MNLELKGWTADNDRRQQLNGVIVGILLDGPTRVIVTKDGYCVPPDQIGSYGVRPVTVYIRDDGWSLGVPYEFAEQGFGMWKDSWVAAISCDSRPPCLSEVVMGRILAGEVVL
jgi:hypothetical protein